MLFKNPSLGIKTGLISIDGLPILASDFLPIQASITAFELEQGFIFPKHILKAVDEFKP